VVPPSDNKPVPVIPPPGLHDITSVFTNMPVATDRLFADMVKEPVVALALLVMVPDALRLPPKSVAVPVALKLQSLAEV